MTLVYNCGSLYLLFLLKGQELELDTQWCLWILKMVKNYCPMLTGYPLNHTKANIIYLVIRRDNEYKLYLEY